jgi:hypothetical protein
VNNNYLDLDMNKSGFVHTLSVVRLTHGPPSCAALGVAGARAAVGHCQPAPSGGPGRG